MKIIWNIDDIRAGLKYKNPLNKKVYKIIEFFNEKGECVGWNSVDLYMDIPSHIDIFPIDKLLEHLNHIQALPN